MKFNEDILKELGLEPNEKQEPVNVMRVSEMLDFMKQCAERIESKSRKYTTSRELHQQKLIWLMENCSSGVVDVYKDIYTYCLKQELLEKFTNRNI